MRLHRLTMTAVGPYADTEEIDFDRLSASGLFLLEGPTGAGKSTILDAITFALYGSTAGGEESSGLGRLQGQFAAPEIRPQVVLEASFRGVRYRVTRVPAHTRPKKRGTGTTKDSGSVLLERQEGNGWVAVSEDKHDTTGQIQRIVGLDRDQFTTVVVLPQGEFARFLRAGDEDRRTLLTKLFGTALYERITDRLDADRRTAFEAVTEAKTHLSGAVDRALGAAGIDAERGVAVTDAVGGAVEDLERELDRVGGEVHEAHQRASAEAAKAKERLGNEAKAKDEAETRHKLRQGLDEAQAQLAAHERSRAEQEASQSRAEAAERAARVSPVLGIWSKAREELGEAVATLIEACPDATDEERQGDGAEALRTQASQGREAAARLEAEETREAGLSARRDQLKEQQDELERLQKQCDDLNLDLDSEREGSSASRLAALTEQREECRRASEQLISAQGEAVRAKKAAEAAEERDRLAQGIGEQEANVTAALGHKRERDAELIELMDRRIAGMAAELAATLVPGEPCSVCGSPEHPMPAEAADDAVSQEQVEKARRVAKEADKAHTAAKEAVSDSRAALEGHKALCGDEAAAKLRDDANTARKTRDDLKAQSEALPTVEREVGDLDDRLGNARRRLLDLREDIAGREAGLRRDAEALAADDRSLADARGDHPTVAERRAALIAAAEAGEQRADLVTAIETAVTAEQRSGLNAREAATGAGFADAAEAEAALLDEAVLAELKASIEAWDKKRTQLATIVADARFADVREQTVEELAQALGTASGKFTEAERAEGKARTNETTAANHAAAWDDARTGILDAAETLQSAKAAYQPIAELADYAKGNTGQRRSTLLGYVLRTRFEDVVQQANHRLGVMSQHRYALRRTEEGEKKRDRVGLGLAVVDSHTGESRATNTLSGGEQFYTSLALALGLADVVKAEAGGIELDTLFIDEGFGSLDGETLEQVMAVIDELRGGGRVVGIVSHVEGLKEQVPERVEVRRLPSGASRLTVRA